MMYLSGFSIGFIIVSIILFLIVGYLLFIPNKSQSTRYMTLFLAGIGAPFVMFAVVFSSLDIDLTRVSLWVLHLAIFGIHGLLMFAYTFPHNLYKKEKIIASRVSMSASILALAAYIAVSLSIEPMFIAEADIYYFNIPIPGIVIGLQFGVMFWILFRKLYFYSRYPKDFAKDHTLRQKAVRLWRILSDKSTKEAHAIRGFIALFGNAFLIAVAIVMATIGAMSWLVNAYFVVIGILFLLFFFVLFTIDTMPEPTTFQVKLIGATLIGTLVTLGIVGLISTEETKQHFQAVKSEQIDKLYYDVATARGVEDMLYVVRIEDGKVLHARTPQMQKYLENFAQKRFLYPPKESQTLFFSAFDIMDASSFVMTQEVLLPDGLYEVGFAYASFRQAIQAGAMKVLIVLIASTLFIVVAFPFFFRGNIARPLKNLLQGVRQVDAGNLDTKIAIVTKDEIGLITRSFNAMTASLKHSKKRLEEYATNLEAMVKERTGQLHEAKKETDVILDNVDEGLFLIVQEEGEFVIGSQYSAKLEEILGQRHLAKIALSKLLGGRVEKLSVEDIEKYMRLLFKSTINEDTLETLNVLNEVGCNTPAGEKHLVFKFRRVYREGVIAHILATVRDITQEVKLKALLHATEAKNRVQMDMLFKIIHADTSMLHDFLEGVQEELDVVDAVLGIHGDALESKVAQLYRSVHTIKGNAALLELDFVANTAHEIEDKLQALRLKSSVQGQDFVSIAFGIEHLKEVIAEMHALVKKLVDFKSNLSTQGQNLNTIMMSALRNLVDKIAQNAPMAVEIEAKSFDVTPLSTKQRIAIKDVLIQCARNSMVHGAQSTQTRLESGKSEAMHITIETRQTAKNFILVYEDDGAGIDVNRLKTKARQMAIDTTYMSDKEAMGLIFYSGLSTANEVSMDAGRGVGMDLIEQKLRDMGGSIEVESQLGAFTRFTVTLRLS
ncbi:MAG: hypothetical protein KU37_09880 [Sulfuricurvum sp. PC08-66]|nr:MAG: hypothetical protein KU37_09880 [Sulfuricurvum sp. PC08-66]